MITDSRNMEVGCVRTMTVKDYGIEFISGNREIIIDLGPEDLGLESWEEVKVYDLKRVGLWNLKHKNEPILPLALIGPRGTVVLLKWDDRSDLRFRAERMNYVDRILISRCFGTQRVSPVIITPEEDLIQADITCRIGGGFEPDTDTFFAKSFVQEVNELRSRAFNVNQDD